MAAKRGRKGPMSDEHKAALAQGRAEGEPCVTISMRLRANKPKRGRKRTPDSIKKRLAAIDEQLTTADPLDELRLVQERRDLDRASWTRMGQAVDLGGDRGRPSSRSPPATASARGSPTRRGARSASRPPCSSGPASAARRLQSAAARRDAGAPTRSRWRSERSRSNASSSAVLVQRHVGIGLEQRAEIGACLPRRHRVALHDPIGVVTRRARRRPAPAAPAG